MGDGFDPAVVQYALMAATLVKVCVDIANVATPANTPRWMSPLLALLLGPLMVATLMLAGGTTMTAQSAAQAVIGGVLSAGTAGVASSLQARTKPSTPPSDNGSPTTGAPIDGSEMSAEKIADVLERRHNERVMARLHEVSEKAAREDIAAGRVASPPQGVR